MCLWTSMFTYAQDQCTCIYICTYTHIHLCLYVHMCLFPCIVWRVPGYVHNIGMCIYDISWSCRPLLSHGDSEEMYEWRDRLQYSFRFLEIYVYGGRVSCTRLRYVRRPTIHIHLHILVRGILPLSIGYLSRSVTCVSPSFLSPQNTKACHKIKYSSKALCWRAFL